MSLETSSNGAMQPGAGGGGAAPAPVGFVTISEAARRLEINKSSVSRQVAKLEIAKDAHGRIDFDDYVRRRETDLNPLMARGGGMADPERAASAGAAAANSGRASSAARVGHNASNDLKRLQAEDLQLKLDEKRAKIIDRALVNEVVMTAARTMRDTMLGLSWRLADDFASMTDPAEIRGRLDSEIRRTLESMAAGFSELQTAPAPVQETEAA